jgi:hypothetical protein
MTRDELKEIVKECLLEIIIEGSPRTVVESVRKRNSKSPPAEVAPPTTRRPALDLVHPRGRPSVPRSAAQLQQAPASRPRPSPANYRELVGGNDVMASVFADTAASGLVESLGNPGQASSNPIIDTGVDPNLFEGASNWSALAFAEPTKTHSR